MAISLWRPYSELSLADRDVGTLFNRFFGRTFLEAGAEQVVPPLEVRENNQEIRVQLEIPGVAREDVSITLANDLLEVSGEKRVAEEAKDELCECSERSYGKFVRTLSVPSSIDGGKISATFKDGVLEIRLPKREEAKPKQVKIEIS